MHHVSHVTCHVSHLTCQILYICVYIFFLRNKKIKKKKIIKRFLIQNTPSSFLQCNEEFKKVCQLCNEDIVMKSWVVGMNQTSEMLRSLNLHLTKKHGKSQEKEGEAFGGRPLLKGARVPGTFSGTVFLEATLLQMFVVLFVARSFI